MTEEREYDFAAVLVGEDSEWIVEYLAGGDGDIVIHDAEVVMGDEADAHFSHGRFCDPFIGDLFDGAGAETGGPVWEVGWVGGEGVDVGGGAVDGDAEVGGGEHWGRIEAMVFYRTLEDIHYCLHPVARDFLYRVFVATTVCLMKYSHSVPGYDQRGYAGSLRLMRTPGVLPLYHLWIIAANATTRAKMIDIAESNCKIERINPLIFAHGTTNLLYYLNDGK